MTTNAILAIDQGTTSTRTIIFDQNAKELARAQMTFDQHYPADGWVEHDPEDIWKTTQKTVKDALEIAAKAGIKPQTIGITNQRETVIVWERKNGKPIYNAIVWQDRRTANTCDAIKAQGIEATIQYKTGLLIDPYFSATKIAWILDNVSGARAKAERGELACGTVDSYLIWQLTNGALHATDATNASRTSLFNIRTQEWDAELLEIFNVPASLLPEVKNCADDYGLTSKAAINAEIPISGVAGDQQAAAIGQACFTQGAIKSTYGTGCFALINTGKDIQLSSNRLLSTIAYRLNGECTYAIEGSIFIAGAAVQWLRDELGVLDSAAETAKRAMHATADANVVMVPAFTGMGAPHWSPNARAAVFGMTRATGPNELARAALEGVIYQTNDLFDAMAGDDILPTVLRVDGGMVANDWFVQKLSDILNIPVERPTILETTALGAAFLAGLQIGIYSGLEEIAQKWSRAHSSSPNMAVDDRQKRLRHWKACVDAVLSVAKAE